MSQLRNDRIILPVGKQEKLISSIVEKTGLQKSAKIARVSERTIRDWRREKYAANLDSLKSLCQESNMQFPTNYKTRCRFAHTSRAGKKGGKAVYKKYGRIPSDEKKRQEGWRRWWDKKGQVERREFFSAKPIKEPRKSKDLAEFVGIMMGDGGVRERQITVTLHKKDDKRYSEHVSKLITRLFNVPVATNYKKDKLALDLVVSRTILVEYCVTIGLTKGNKIKNGMHIPRWIQENESFKKSWIKGLIDTDGCIFEETHRVKNKVYKYPRLHFVNASKPLLNDVHKTMTELGYNARIRNNRAVTLEKRKDVVKYFRSIGSNNPKHIEKYIKFIEKD